MPLDFWDEAFKTSIYLISRLSILNGLTPLEALLKVSPQYNSLQVFGYYCFPNIRDFNQQKLQFDLLNALFFEIARMIRVTSA